VEMLRGSCWMPTAASTSAAAQIPLCRLSVLLGWLLDQIFVKSGERRMWFGTGLKYRRIRENQTKSSRVSILGDSNCVDAMLSYVSVQLQGCQLHVRVHIIPEIARR